MVVDSCCCTLGGLDWAGHAGSARVPTVLYILRTVILCTAVYILEGCLAWTWTWARVLLFFFYFFFTYISVEEKIPMN